MTDMTFSASDLQKRIRDVYPSAVIHVRDDSAKHAHHKKDGGGGHYHVTMIDASFEGMSLIKRHQAIYALFSHDFLQRIHALSLRLLTPREHAAKVED